MTATFDDLTPHLNLPLPHVGNAGQDDVARLRAAILAIDSAVRDLDSLINDGPPANDRVWSSQKTRSEIDAKEALPGGGTSGDVLTGNKAWKSAADLPINTETQQAIGFLAPKAQPTLTGLREVRVAMTGGDIDLALGNLFTKTVAGPVTLTPINVPPSGTVAACVLELHNGASAAVTWWGGIVGPPISLTTGRDVFVLYTHDGGATWTRVQAAKGL